MTNPLRRLAALINARTKEYYRDHTTLMWTFIFPFLVLIGFAYGYQGHQEPLLKFGVIPASAISSPALSDLRSLPQLQFVGFDDQAAALDRITRHQLDLVYKPEGGEYWINSESPKATLAERLLKTDLTDGAGPRLVKQELTGKKLRYADWLVPGLVGMNLMFGSLFGVGYVIVRYRKNGVLKRLRATPLTAFEFLLAQIVSRTLLILVTSAITIEGACLLIGFHVAGSWLHLLAFVAVGGGSLIALGMLVAARISSEEVAEGVLNVMTWPMMFLSGVWFSLDGASPWVLAVSKCLPLTHVVGGLRAIMLDGASIMTLLPELGALALFAVVLLAIGSLIFKWS